MRFVKIVLSLALVGCLAWPTLSLAAPRTVLAELMTNTW